MKGRFRLYFLTVLAGLAFPLAAFSDVVFSKGEKAKWVTPGEEETSGTAQQLFDKAQQAEAKGDLKGAIKYYRGLSRHYPKDALAPGAVFKMAELQEKRQDYLNAAASYRLVVLKYSRFDRFDDAVEAQFRIGEMYLAGKKLKLFGLKIKTSLEDAATIFAGIVATAPYGKYAARAQFDIGLVREKQGASQLAVQAYQAVIDKYPNDPLAADAQYQIGYLWLKSTRQGTNDSLAAKNARTGFEDFLYRHPNSEKSAQARQNLASLEHKQTADSFQIAKYYDKQKFYRAAVIYYNEVVRQQPGSKESEHAQMRIAQLRKKVGEAALQPAVPVSTRKKSPSQLAGAGGSNPGGRAPEESAPLPPPENDASLPPPASLSPDSTTAPVADPSLQTPATPAASASPEPSASPQP